MIYGLAAALGWGVADFGAAVVGRRFILLHAFSKKTDKTPARELEIAERRLADFFAETGKE